MRDWHCSREVKYSLHNSSRTKKVKRCVAESYVGNRHMKREKCPVSGGSARACGTSENSSQFLERYLSQSLLHRAEGCMQRCALWGWDAIVFTFSRTAKVWYFT